jgi:hypothetical protein
MPKISEGLAVREKEQTAQDMLSRRVNTVQRIGGDKLDPEVSRAIAESPELFQDFVKSMWQTKDTKYKVDFKTYDGQVYKIITDANTGETISEEPLGAAASTAPQVNIDMGDKGQAQYGKDLGGRLAERDFNIVEAANQAAPSLEKINQTLDVLEYGDVSTGLGADFMTDVNRFRSQFLNDKKAGKRVSDTQLLEALLGSEVFPLITQLGIGARGLDTPAERDFLRSVFTGAKEMDRDSLIKLTKLREKVAKKAINRYNNMLKAGKFKNYEQVQGYPLEPLAYPEREAPPKPIKRPINELTQAELDREQEKAGIKKEVR